MTMLHGNFEGQAAPHNPGLFEWLFGQRKHAPDKQANDRDNLSVVERFRVRHLPLIEQVCKFLANAGLDPIPDHYELGWLYVAGTSGMQRLKIETHLLEYGRIDPVDAVKLLDDIRATMSERALSDMIEEAKHKIGEARATTEQSSRDAASFGINLGISLSDLGDPEKSKTAIVKLQKITAQMMERTARAEAELKNRAKTMGQLRSRLVQSQKLALSDPLTDLPNRRAFDINIKETIELARSKRQPLSIGFCDIDHFKSINDAHGHATGDRVIRYVADTLKKVVGQSIHVARHGGEEFALIFPDKTAEKTADILDNARLALNDRTLYARNTSAEIGHISFSGGVAELRCGENVSALLMRADNALYRAKETGRNKILIAP